MKYDYREEAKTVEWQRKSGEIKERDDYTCFLCGSKDKFVHVHHRYYDGRLHYWEYPDDSLETPFSSLTAIHGRLLADVFQKCSSASSDT